ncbi:hypothetical protein BDW22DRAFT_1361433 [Trametopsis cervina]|nr:hypothetical protein BDW22DRAFT_1361433 [Trametopsis cervina]
MRRTVFYCLMCLFLAQPQHAVYIPQGEGMNRMASYGDPHFPILASLMPERYSLHDLNNRVLRHEPNHNKPSAPDRSGGGRASTGRPGSTSGGTSIVQTNSTDGSIVNSSDSAMNGTDGTSTRGSASEGPVES